MQAGTIISDKRNIYETVASTSNIYTYIFQKSRCFILNI